MAYNPDKEITLGPWPKGMNNRQPDYALPPGTLRNVVNADFDSAGYVKRRDGYSKVYSGVGLHSGFSCPAGQYFVEGQYLKQLLPDNTTVSLLFGIHGPVAYEHFNGVVYLSDGVINRKIVNGGTVKYWGISAPPAPNLNAGSGVMGGGTYLAVMTRVVDGIEHGASDVTSITVADSSSITFSSLPSTTALRLYMSTADGAILYLVGEVAAGTSSFAVPILSVGAGKPVDTQFMSPPPAGRIIREFNGRLYIADGNTVWYTEPYAVDRVKLSSNFYQFTAPVTVIEPVLGGIWIVADRTYFFAGKGPDSFVQKVALNYGAVFGTSLKTPDSGVAMWYSETGVVSGDHGGVATNMQDTNVAVETGSDGAALMRDTDGALQYIAAVKNPVASPLAARSWINMEVIRKAG